MTSREMDDHERARIANAEKSFGIRTVIANGVRIDSAENNADAEFENVIARAESFKRTLDAIRALPVKP